jgi:hypothetical protein
LTLPRRAACLTLLKKLIDTEPLSPAKGVVAFGC